MILTAFSTAVNYTIAAVQRHASYNNFAASEISERLITADVGDTPHTRKAFLEGVHYATDLLHQFTNKSRGAIFYQEEGDPQATTLISEDGPTNRPGTTSLTRLSTELVSEDTADYMSANILSEGLRLYWSKVILDLVRKGIPRGRGPVNPTVDSVRKSIREYIPSRGNDKVKYGYSPAYCDLSGSAVIIRDGIAIIDTTINCYGGLKVPVHLEVDIYGGI